MTTLDYSHLNNNLSFDIYNNNSDDNVTYPYDTSEGYATSTELDGNSTGNSTDVLNNIYILPVWRQIVWSILFAGMIAVATVGNLVVIWIVLAHKRMRTVTNYFIVNLSIADAMVSTLNTALNFVYMLNSNWPFGTLFCKISQFVANTSICASVFTLMAIAIDRYMAIMNPLKPRMGKKLTLCIAVLIWIIGIISSCPNFFFFTTFDIPTEDRVVCYAEWPDADRETNHSIQEYVYNVVFMILTYFVPIGSMTYTYTRVGLELWGSQSIGECTQRQLDNIKSKRKVVLMMIMVVLIFAVCWLPQNVYFIITSYYPSVTTYPYIQEIYLGIYWLAMSNSMYNPIIYCIYSDRFRRGFKQFFRWCPFIHVGPEVLTRREVVSRYSCSGSPDHHRIVRNDTERSFLYSCSGSPKGHRKSHGSVRVPLQMSKCNHNTNSTYFSMNSFNNNNNNNTNMTIQSGNDETNVTTSDNLLLQSTTNSSQRWATTRNLNGNGQRTSLS
ncbi:tachykinin-like peptides receptor 99D isoform X2 [Chironomus tepperi]|uniref:tachykinin-like peptides receptor 99D isoform X2 n=1 Tax=Chironomus tepperi TaxID=113505 RepID=UPI00391FB7B1